MNAPQRTDAWFAERAGHCTASRAADVLAKIKSGEAALRRKYRLNLVTERLTGNPVTGYQNAAMIWGTQTEPEARMALEATTGALVQEVGFIKHPTIPWVGCSPDGVIGDDGLLEIKCPESTTHLEWLEQNRVPPEHIPQLQFQLWVTERKWVSFASYDPRFPPGLQLFIVRVERDEDYIKQLHADVCAFLLEVEGMVERLLKRKT
jgi:putative phage-type endonuclease